MVFHDFLCVTKTPTIHVSPKGRRDGTPRRARARAMDASPASMDAESTRIEGVAMKEATVAVTSEDDDGFEDEDGFCLVSDESARRDARAFVASCVDDCDIETIEADDIRRAIARAMLEARERSGRGKGWRARARRTRRWTRRAWRWTKSAKKASVALRHPWTRRVAMVVMCGTGRVAWTTMVAWAMW